MIIYFLAMNSKRCSYLLLFTITTIMANLLEITQTEFHYIFHHHLGYNLLVYVTTPLV